MSKSTPERTIKNFIFAGMLLEDELSRLEEAQGISVKGTRSDLTVSRVDPNDYSPRLFFHAKQMAEVYTAFFCLENAVRDLITDRLAERNGPNWWDTCVPPKINASIKKLKENEEKNRYHAQRSSSNIGYTMFGNLAQIIIARWDDFSDLFPDQHWISSRFNDLEKSRNIIMHTGVLPTEEIERIESISRDWIRQVG